MPIGRGNAPTLRVQTSIIKKNQRTCNDADGDLRDQLALEGMALADRLLLRLPPIAVGDAERGFIARIRLQLDLCGLHVHSQVNLRAYGQGDLSAVSGPDCTDSTAQEAHCAHPCHRAKLTTTGQSSTSLKIDPYKSVSNQASTCLADTGSTLVPRRSHEQPDGKGLRTLLRNCFAGPSRSIQAHHRHSRLPQIPSPTYLGAETSSGPADRPAAPLWGLPLLRQKAQTP